MREEKRKSEPEREILLYILPTASSRNFAIAQIICLSTRVVKKREGWGTGKGRVVLGRGNHGVRVMVIRRWAHGGHFVFVFMRG